MDAKLYSMFAYPIYGFIIFLLILVLIIGTEIKGAQSWIRLGMLQIQPSEFSKFATSLALSKFLCSYDQKIHRVSNLLKIFTIIMVPTGLILLQPDMGSALVFSAFLLVLYREGLSGIFLFIVFLAALLFTGSMMFTELQVIIAIFAISYLVYILWDRKLKNGFIALLILVLSALFFWLIKEIISLDISLYKTIIFSASFSLGLLFILALKHKKKKGLIIIAFIAGSIIFSNMVMYLYDSLKTHQQKRINITLGLESDPSGAGWNLYQSKLAIGSGGFSGKGYLNGTHTKGDYVPEQNTDFIFCTIGEEWGFIGTSILIILFIILLLRLIYLAECQRSLFSRVYGYGVISILFFHVAINISMTIGLFPVIGIPLPFISYGGSSLWAFTILLFIFLRLDSSRLEYLH